MKWKIVISWLLVFLWMGAIFWLSGMDSTESGSKSKGAISKVIEGSVDVSNKLGITDKHPSDEKIESVTKVLNSPLRKCMHASVYLVLAILVANALLIGKTKLKYALIFSFLISFLYACSDEIHQLFVPGRSGELFDVFIDTCGASLGIIIFYLFYRLYLKKKRQSA